MLSLNKKWGAYMYFSWFHYYLLFPNNVFVIGTEVLSLVPPSPPPHTQPPQSLKEKGNSFCTPDRRQSKTLLLSTNIDQTLLETEFLIAISRQMAFKNTVSSDFWSTFVDCLVRFLLLPIRCVLLGLHLLSFSASICPFTIFLKIWQICLVSYFSLLQ